MLILQHPPNPFGLLSCFRILFKLWPTWKSAGATTKASLFVFGPTNRSLELNVTIMADKRSQNFTVFAIIGTALFTSFRWRQKKCRHSEHFCNPSFF